MPDVIKDLTAQGAEPSPAPASPTTDLSQLSSEEYSTWERTGKLPEAPKPQAAAPAATRKDEKPAPQPGQPAEGEEEAAAAPGADETTQDEHGTRKPGRKPGAEDRIGQLTAQLRQAERDRDEALGKLKGKTQEPPKPPEAAKFKPTRPRPTSADTDEKSGEPKYKTLDDLLEARDAWNREQWDAEKAFNDRQSKEADERDTVVRQFGERVQKSEAKHADFKRVAFESDITCPSNVNDAKKIREGSVIDAFIIDSEIGPEVLYFLGSNPGEIEKINGLSPFQQARYLTALEAELSDEDGEETPAAAAPAKPAPPARQHTQAPPPARAVGGRNSAQADPIKSAAEAGNFAEYEAKANARDLARRR